MEGIQTQVSKRGGNRAGAGRKSLEYHVRNDAKFLAARGVNPLLALEILSRVVDERKVWHRILHSEDDGVVLRAMMFLVQMRDGKPTQQINVTSQSIQLQAKDIETARAIIAEVRGEFHAQSGNERVLDVSQDGNGDDTNAGVMPRLGPDTTRRSG